MAKTTVDKEGNEHELVLYKFDSCPFCRMVMYEVEKMNLSITYKDTLMEDGMRQELIDIGGKSQVPCLLIDGEPLYESQDIIRYLKQNYS